VSVGDHQPHAAQPATCERARKPLQKGFASDGPIAMPSTSRTPSVFTATAIISATETTTSHTSVRSRGFAGAFLMPAEVLWTEVGKHRDSLQHRRAHRAQEDLWRQFCRCWSIAAAI
jgi:hypothetical protein